MIITIDLNNAKSTYMQIVDCIRKAVATGALQAGDQLPTIREAAIQARVNRNTVSRAYLELEHLGLVRTRQGSGCFISDVSAQIEKSERLRLLEKKIGELLLEAQQYQITIDEVIQLIRKEAEAWGKESNHE